jgi:hypothetical protein
MGHSVSLSVTNDVVVFHHSTRDGLELREAMAITIATMLPEPTKEALLLWPTLPDLSTDRVIVQTHIEPIVEVDPFYNPNTNNDVTSGHVTPDLAGIHATGHPSQIQLATIMC